MHNAVWISVLMFFSPTFLQEICVSNHTQKQQKRQTIHKDSISHQVLQVDGFFFIMIWLYTYKALSVTLPF